MNKEFKKLKRKFTQNPLNIICSIIFIFFLLVAFLPSVFAPYDPIAMDPDAFMSGPSAQHWFGTDQFGRDILSRIIYGVQGSLYIASMAIVFASIAGTIIGSVSGYLGGVVDNIIMRFIDAIIDNLQRKIERQVINYVTRFQPLAKELRYIVSIVKFANDLERIGDHAVNIAKIATKYKGLPPSYSFINIRKMTGYTEKMMKDIFDAYYQSDINKAKKVYKMDKKVDNLYKLIRKNIAYVIKEENDTEKAALFLDLILVSRYLERAADHTKNIASEIHYVETGISLKEVTL